tara:strand:+ start:5712 stop:6281 length:570 start_codon:yes stop_codon:yes gene_type:complete
MTKHWMTRKEIMEKFEVKFNHLNVLNKNGAIRVKYIEREEGQKGRNPMQLNVADVKIFVALDKDAKKLILRSHNRSHSLKESVDLNKKKNSILTSDKTHFNKGEEIHDLYQDYYPYTMKKKTEMVNHPKHYNPGKIEVITAIEDWGLDFNEGNVIKYIVRAKQKNNRKQDLEKALWYINRMIVNLKMGK